LDEKHAKKKSSRLLKKFKEKKDKSDKTFKLKKKKKKSKSKHKDKKNKKGDHLCQVRMLKPAPPKKIWTIKHMSQFYVPEYWAQRYRA